ncbi:integral membrane protein [Tamaricihabitans halophyticus]|uniref:Integral membrane protein n=1 Tax=Tamaricihabitans halophyticus TaxID=1262583 RepID=A0A4R2QHS2_9PSEU|nr:DUF3817 domain-containing protein [Tamaricihabitans halophyticus]TCP47918.1 integral membrane protein [Tamaricihabitans halophyticus]
MSSTEQRTPAPTAGALLRFRVIAYVVGIGLLALVGAMVLKYAADTDGPMGIIGPVHGFLYVVYLVLAADLAMKARWSLKGTIFVLLAGTIPFLSFVAERKVAQKVQAGVRL